MSTEKVDVDRWQDLKPGDEIVAITDPHAPGQFTVRREVPEPMPGTVGTAAVFDGEAWHAGITVVRTDEVDYVWWSLEMVGDNASYTEDHLHREVDVRDFVPDDAEALRAKVTKLQTVIDMADKAGADIIDERNELVTKVNDLADEVERLRAAKDLHIHLEIGGRDMGTIIVDTVRREVRKLGAALRPGGKARVTGASYGHVIQIGSTVTIIEPGSYPGDYWVEGPSVPTGVPVKQVLHSDALEAIS
jgi:hypothetical protein